MRVIGFSSGVVYREGNVDRMVKAILEKSGHEHEFVKLTNLTYSPCKGCVELCAEPQVCQLEDDLYPYYHKIKEADAVVVGSPVSLTRSTGSL
jgi:multimeric flavodoxin WrbA